MALLPLEESVIEQRQAELKEELMPVSAVGMANAEALTVLCTVRSFEFPKESGNVYEIPLVPFYEGNQIYMNYLHFRDASQHPDHVRVGVYEKIMEEVIETAWRKLIVPKSRWTRLRKKLRLMRNPLYKMSDAEISDLLSFLLARRMTSSVQFHYPARKENRGR